MKELRYTKTLAELRANDTPTADNDDDFSLEGYAATFGNESTDEGLGFKEVIMPGAFSRSIREGDDVRALVNHNPDKVLGRIKNRTLSLREDKKGLLFHVRLDRQNPDHRAIHASIRRGDIDACSFGFVARSQEWADVRGKDGVLYAQRRLHDVQLMDVSAVTYPAYGETAVAARSMFPEGIPQEIRSRFPNFGNERSESAARAIGARRLNSLLLS